MARRLRREPNAAEAAAWDALRTLRRHGIAVRRQHPIGPYVVDFAIVRQRIVIEIDGGIHRVPGKVDDDAKRQADIEALGWRIIRAPNEVARSPDHLLALIQSDLGI